MKVLNLGLFIMTVLFLYFTPNALGQFKNSTTPSKQETNLNNKKTISTKQSSTTKQDKEQIAQSSHVHEEKSFNDYLIELKNWFLTVGIQAAAIIITTLIAVFFSNLLSKKLFNFVVKDRVDTELKKRATTLSTICRYLMVIGILAIGGMMLLRKLGIDIAPLLAGAGVLGIAIGFGAQNIVKDVISGAFILLEDQIRVGDVVQILDKCGVVERVTLRMVVLRDLSGNVHFIPSGDIQTVTNMTKTYSRYLFDIGVAYKEDTDNVIELMNTVDEEMRKDEEFNTLILSPLEIMGVQRFESSSVVIRARIKTQPGSQWKVGREFNRRFKKSFDEHGIEIPFPHMTVFQGTSKSGDNYPFDIHFQNVPGDTKQLNTIAGQ